MMKKVRKDENRVSDCLNEFNETATVLLQLYPNLSRGTVLLVICCKQNFFFFFFFLQFTQLLKSYFSRFCFSFFICFILFFCYVKNNYFNFFLYSYQLKYEKKRMKKAERQKLLFFSVSKL